jgi:hypothetical protein
MKRCIVGLLLLLVATSLAAGVSNAVQFSTDVVDFVELGNVVVNSPIAIDRLVNGPSSEVTVGVAATPPAGASPTAGLNK